MRIGMHVRGFDAGRPVAAAKALERGAEAVQIFTSNPRQWRVPPVDPAADAEMRLQLAGVPFICETPGEVEDDRANIAVLKSLRDGRPVVLSAGSEAPSVEQVARPH